MLLQAGYTALLLKIQEAAGDLTSNDVAARLRDAISDKHRGTGTWAYFITYIGDGESGDVIYCCDDDVMQAPYAIEQADGGAAKCTIDFEDAVDVVPRTIYEPEIDDEDDAHFASMVTEKLYTPGPVPFCERYISKAQRDKMPAEDFAGKGNSFPIKTQADVDAAVRSIGRAGSANYSGATIKANIKKIAKRKGLKLPKSWEGGSDAKEGASGSASAGGQLSLVESAATIESGVFCGLLRETAGAKTVPIKLIAPGKGSSAVYPAEVLKRDGPGVFKAGTHVYANHATAAEEAARPEGDVTNLAGVLLKDAAWHDSFMHKGKDMGAGLYSEVKPFSDHSVLFDEKGDYLGMSIRASGVAESGRKQEGLPILKQLTAASSVDVVTRAGAGGMILSESAATPAIQTQEASDMDAAEQKKIQDAIAANSASTARLLERALRDDAIAEGARILRTVALADSLKTLVIEGVIKETASIPKTDAGALDVAKFTEIVNAEAKRVGQAFSDATGGGRVFSMGGAAEPTVDTKEADRLAAQAKAEEENSVSIFESLGMPKGAAQLAARGRAA